jgi:hypothetical protein
MTIYRTQGKGCTEDEFRQLGLKAGFTDIKAIYLDPFYMILEFIK